MQEQGTAVQDMAKEQVQCFICTARGLRPPSMSAPSLYHYLDVTTVRMQEWNATMNQMLVCLTTHLCNIHYTVQETPFVSPCMYILTMYASAQHCLSVWLVEPSQPPFILVVWRFSLMAIGALSVMIAGAPMMPGLCADNWDTPVA